MSATTITAIAGLVTAVTALVHCFTHTHAAPPQPTKESETTNG